MSELPEASALEELHERIEAYMLKAVREAKTRTSWTHQNREYEDALVSFLRGLFHLDYQGNNPFLAEVQELAARIARPGFWNSLARTLIQFTSPGTPDLYQGDELWNFALVDPDNRRPVDYETRQRLLDDVIMHIEAPEESRRAFLKDLVKSPEDGRIKLHLIHTVLATRHNHPHLFSCGQYLPLAAEGAASEHVFAFARLGRIAPECEVPDEAAILVAPRLPAALIADPALAPVGDDVWTDTALRLPDPLRQRTWRCAFTSETFTSGTEGNLKVAQALSYFPAALLIGKR